MHINIQKASRLCLSILNSLHLCKINQYIKYLPLEVGTKIIKSFNQRDIGLM